MILHWIFIALVIIFGLLGIGCLSSALNRQHLGIFIGGAFYLASAIIAFSMGSWWPLLGGFIVTQIVGRLGFDPYFRKSKNQNSTNVKNIKGNQNYPQQRINFTCNNCGKEFNVRAEVAGRKGKCGCGEIIEIPNIAENVYGNEDEVENEIPKLTITRNSEVAVLHEYIRNNDELMKKIEQAYKFIWNQYKEDSGFDFESISALIRPVAMDIFIAIFNEHIKSLSRIRKKVERNDAIYLCFCVKHRSIR